MTTKNQTATWGALLSGMNGLRVLTLCGGVALYAVNINVISTLLPSIVKEIGGLELYSWAISLFMAAAILSVSLCASLIDYVGLRAAFLLAVLVFLMGSLGIMVSPDIYFLLGARTVQGLGGGLLLGLSYTAIRMVFSEPLWLRATALISSVWGVSALSGPAIGGLFAQSGQWRLAFLGVIPITVIVAILVTLSLKPLEENHDQEPLKIPIFKSILLVWSVLVITFGGLTSSVLLVALSFVIVVTILYGITRDDENNGAIPLFPRGSSTLKTPLGSLYAGIGLMSLAMSSEIFVPYFLETIHGLSPLWAGYMTALIPAGWALGALSTANQKPKNLIFANRLFIVGPIISTLSLVVLGVLLWWQALSTELNAVWALSLPLFGIGLGLGVMWPKLLTRVFQSAPESQENVASAAIIMLQLYAVSVGAAMGGVLTSMLGLDGGSASHAQRAALVLFSSFALAPFIFIFILRAARRREALQ